MSARLTDSRKLYNDHIKERAFSDCSYNDASKELDRYVSSGTRTYNKAKDMIERLAATTETASKSGKTTKWICSVDMFNRWAVNPRMARDRSNERASQAIRINGSAEIRVYLQKITSRNTEMKVISTKQGIERGERWIGYLDDVARFSMPEIAHSMKC